MDRQRLAKGAWFARVWWWRSGVSARAYCLAQGIPYSTIMAWRARLVRELAGGAAAVSSLRSMTPSLPLWVCAESVDFRLGIDGLALKVQASLGPQRALNAAHVFFNRGRDKVKVLWYDRHGWWLMYKRLERGRFSAVRSGELSESELRLVLEGVDLSVRRFAPVRGARVA